MSNVGHGPLEWTRVCPFLDRALSGECVPDNNGLAHWLEAARRCRVLTYAQSAQCARLFVETRVNDIAQRMFGSAYAPATVETCELWSVKEGHTSSVWQATVRFVGYESQLKFALNVARDLRAGEELVGTDQQLRKLYALDPEGVVEVLATDTVEIKSDKESWTVPVDALRWLNSAVELHVLPDPGTGCGRFILVDWFLSPTDSPGGMQTMFGSGPIIELSDQIWSCALWHLLAQSEFTDHTVVRIPQTEINEGDWVWNGRDTVLVAVSDEEIRLPLGAAAYYFLLLYARQGDRRVHWGNLQRALQTILQAERHMPPITSRLEEWLRAALATPTQELERLGVVADSISAALAASARVVLREAFQRAFPTAVIGHPMEGIVNLTQEETEIATQARCIAVRHLVK